ncbi:MAG: FeoB-associated Cys-rich membrane protein [Eubacteriales bacterium]|nr:FeoB-associated Cys-rich membrane protein [Eubacteriales bacterium]MDD3880795.1 FeoB-associated Cys-rich membrane protein [Eubacteriales bacterium]MDD4511838.1 FeoB-associated Cys-rich membrane protein [Eubacteriales bacterium]
MATWIVGGILAAIVAAIIVKMARDKKRGKGACACGGDCSRCHVACSGQPK